MKNFVGFALLLVGTAGLALAGGIPHVPEVDPAMGIGALTLLSGAVLVIRARRKRQK